MAMPELQSFFGFPLRFGCFVISVLGLGIGGTGLAIIIVFGLVEQIISEYGVKFDPNTKKMVLLSLGMSSILLVIANTCVLLGVFSASSNKIGVGKYISFIFVFFLLGGMMYPSLSCYADKDSCDIVKSHSFEEILLITSALGLLSMLWLYFILTLHNYQEMLV